MDIDLRIMVIILVVIQFIQILAFFHQFNLNKTHKGIGWWLLWSFSEFIGIGFLLLRDTPSIFPLVIVIQNSMLVVGSVFVYIGVRRFFNKPVNVKWLIPGVSVYFAGWLFFLFIVNDIQIRSGIINFTLALFSFFTAYNLFVNRSRNLTTTAYFIGTLFLINGSVFVYRSIMIIAGTPLDDIFAPNLFNLLPYFDILSVNLLSTFGFILMLNQRLNAEMSEAKEDMLLIFNTSPDAALISHLDDGKISEFNDGFMSVTGYNREELSGKSTTELNIWKNIDDRDNVVKLLRDRGSCENYEAHLIRKDGKEITGLISSKIVNLQGVPSMLSIIRDITDRKQHEADTRNLLEMSERSRTVLLSILEDQMQTQRALKDSSKKWQTTFDGIRDSVFLLDADGIILQTNKISQTILGKKEEEIVGHHCHEVMHNSNCHLDDCPFIRMKFTRQRETMLLPVDNKWFEILVDPILDDDNNLTGAVHFICDITNRKQAEQELNKKMDELQRFHNLTVDREITMIELKKEVNELLKQNRQKEKYKIVG